MGQTAGGSHTRTAMGKEMCLINSILFRLFTVKVVAWKTIEFTGKMIGKMVKTVASSFTHRHVKEHRLESLCFQSLSLLQWSVKTVSFPLSILALKSK
jgi:hypothetical protein